MIANAPEKLYLLQDNDLICYCMSNEDDIEYTRTDAFIEKAVNFLEMLGCGFTITDNITHTNYDKEQLVENFKNYIKGE